MYGALGPDNKHRVISKTNLIPTEHWVYAELKVSLIHYLGHQCGILKFC